MVVCEQHLHLYSERKKHPCDRRLEEHCAPRTRYIVNIGTEHYGFVLECNPHDRATLSLPDGSTITLHWNGVPTWESLRDLRLAALTPLQRTAHAHLAQCGERVCVDNDAAALRALNAAAMEALESLPTTLKEDLAQMEAIAGNHCGAAAQRLVCKEGMGAPEELECQVLALRWRIGHKRMLYWASMLCIEES